MSSTDDIFVHVYGFLQHNRTSIGGVYFAALIKPKGWYTVKVVDVLMRPQQQSNTNSVSGTHSADLKSVGGDVTKYNAGKGTIVDSGTTDTYLPSALKAQFQTLFRAYSGREFNNKQTQFSKEQFAKLPVIVFRMMAAGGSGVVDLEVFPSSYMELHRDGECTALFYSRRTVVVTMIAAPRFCCVLYICCICFSVVCSYRTECSYDVQSGRALHPAHLPDRRKRGCDRSECDQRTQRDLRPRQHASGVRPVHLLL